MGFFTDTPKAKRDPRVKFGIDAQAASQYAAESSGVCTYAKTSAPAAFAPSIERTIGKLNKLGEKLDSMRRRQPQKRVKLVLDADQEKYSETALMRLSGAVDELASEIGRATDLRDSDVEELQVDFDAITAALTVLKHDLTRLSGLE